MAATELKNQFTSTTSEARELNPKAAQEVSKILEQAVHREKVPQPVLAYRVPAPGVRYYF